MGLNWAHTTGSVVPALPKSAGWFDKPGRPKVFSPLPPGPSSCSAPNGHYPTSFSAIDPLLGERDNIDPARLSGLCQWLLPKMSVRRSAPARRVNHAGNSPSGPASQAHYVLTFYSRKKTRCPGEKPICSFCERLGQKCIYAGTEVVEEGSDFAKNMVRISTIYGCLQAT